MWRFIAIGLALVVGGPLESRAQVYVEAGATIGHVCLVGEASCADEVAVRGGQLGVWLDEKRAVRFRYLDAPRPDQLLSFDGYNARWSSRGRSLWLGEMTWHYGAPSVARLFVGVSAGVQRDRLTIQCDPPVCDAIRAAGGRVGTQDGPNQFSLGGLVGVSIHPTRRMVVMAGVAAQNFAAEHWGVYGPILHVAYRHPIGR